jgi:hypothetical protein
MKAAIVPGRDADAAHNEFFFLGVDAEQARAA